MGLLRALTLLLALGMVGGCAPISAPAESGGLPGSAAALARDDAPGSGPSPGHGRFERPPLGAKWGWHETERLTPYLEDHLDRGATFFEVAWCEVEPTEGVREWARLDRVVAQAAQRDYHLLLKIRVGSCWATGGIVHGDHPRKTPSALPTNIDAYRTFIGDLATRYGQSVGSFAVENEIDTENHWQVSSADYVTLVRTAAAAIRAANPAARVLDSGVSSSAYGAVVPSDLVQQGRPDEALAYYRAFHRRRWETGQSRFPAVADLAGLQRVLASPRAQRALEAWEATLQLADEGLLDGYQLHFYEPIDTLEAVLGLLESSLPSGLPIEAWEVGVVWPGESFDEHAHAGETAKLLAVLLTRGIAPAVYLPLVHDPSGRFPQETWRGLLKTDGTPRAAGAVVHRLHAAAGEGSLWHEIRAGQLRGIAVGDLNTSTVVLWAATTTRLVAEPPPGATATDLRGAALAWPDGELAIGSDPIFVEWPASPEQVARLLEDPMTSRSAR